MHSMTSSRLQTINLMESPKHNLDKMHVTTGGRFLMWPDMGTVSGAILRQMSLLSPFWSQNEYLLLTHSKIGTWLTSLEKWLLAWILVVEISSPHATLEIVSQRAPSRSIGQWKAL